MFIQGIIIILNIHSAQAGGVHLGSSDLRFMQRSINQGHVIPAHLKYRWLNPKESKYTCDHILNQLQLSDSTLKSKIELLRDSRQQDFAQSWKTLTDLVEAQTVFQSQDPVAEIELNWKIEKTPVFTLMNESARKLFLIFSSVVMSFNDSGFYVANLPFHLTEKTFQLKAQVGYSEICFTDQITMALNPICSDDLRNCKGSDSWVLSANLKSLRKALEKPGKIRTGVGDVIGGGTE